MSSKDYVPLPGRGVRREGNFIISSSTHQSRLWLGADHLLLVHSTLTSQDLKRFYFRHIQALVVRKTQTGRWVNFTLAMIVVLMLGGGINFSGPQGMGVDFVFLTLAGVFGVLLLINWFRGATSECYIQTAVQREKLASLGRLRNARKVIARLRPLIEQAQGTLSAEQAAEDWEFHLQSLPAAARPTPTPTPHPAYPPSGAGAKSGYQGGAHAWLFMLMLAEGALNGVLIFAHTFGLVIVQMFLVLVLVTVGVVALVRQQDSGLPRSVTRQAWAALGYFVFGLIVGAIEYVVISIQNPNAVDNQFSLMLAFAKLQPLETPWLLVTYVISAAAAAIIGLLGMTALRRFRAEAALAAAAPPAAPTPPPLRSPPPLDAPLDTPSSPEPAAVVPPALMPLPPVEPAVSPPPAHG